jgi:hypothetical protein
MGWGTVVVLFVVGAGLTGCGGEQVAGDVLPSETPVPRNVVTPTRASPPPATVAPTPTVVAPVVVKKLVVETRKVAFRKLTVEDPGLAKGSKVVTTRGVLGTRRLTYEVTWVDGVQTKKRLVRQVVVRQPVAQITSVGTKEAEPAGDCDPNYSGACVPIASDVDCAGGSGNGPAYVVGPVQVVGTDIYGLDRDKDGIGCED